MLGLGLAPVAAAADDGDCDGSYQNWMALAGASAEADLAAVAGSSTQGPLESCGKMGSLEAAVASWWWW